MSPRLEIRTIKTWQPSVKDKVMALFKTHDELTPALITQVLDERHSTISMAMINLHREGLLDRYVCKCGRGFVYMVSK